MLHLDSEAQELKLASLVPIETRQKLVMRQIKSNSKQERGHGTLASEND